jgi:hypothetical protein
MKIIVALYCFLFVGLIHAHATHPQLKSQQNPKDCIKHPQIVKSTRSYTSQAAEKAKIIVDKEHKTNSVTKTSQQVPYFGVFNFINFFYTKDTLDNLRVM